MVIKENLFDYSNIDIREEGRQKFPSAVNLAVSTKHTGFIEAEQPQRGL